MGHIFGRHYEFVHSKFTPDQPSQRKCGKARLGNTTKPKLKYQVFYITYLTFLLPKLQTWCLETKSQHTISSFCQVDDLGGLSGTENRPILAVDLYTSNVPK
uniref:Fibroblast growth factor receptor 2 n=1 Tax=Lygus hesperus TaxID=30085 RepID=A0A0A9YAY3_LYGHE